MLLRSCFWACIALRGKRRTARLNRFDNTCYRCNRLVSSVLEKATNRMAARIATSIVLVCIYLYIYICGHPPQELPRA